MDIKQPAVTKSNTFGSPPVVEENPSNFRVTVEPAGFLYIIANVIQGIVTPNLFLLKVCAVNFQINLTLCDPRNQTLLIRSPNGTMLADRIQGYVSTLNIYGSLIDNVPTIFLMLFVLPWSDKHGRKPLLIAPLIGHMICTIIDLINYYIPSLPAEYLLIATVPVGLTGGRGTFFMGMFRYMIDITSAKSRTWRLAIVTGVTGIAVPIGNVISAYIYSSGGYLAIWITSLSIHSAALLYITFFIKDSRGQLFELPIKTINNNEIAVDEGRNLKRKILNHCAIVFRNLWKNFQITFQRREGYKRAIICLLLFSNCLFLFGIANGGIGYLYARKKFGWDAPDWALYMSVVSSTGALGSLILVPLLSGILKVPDGVLGIISLIGSIGSSLTVAFAVSTLMMYLSAIGHALSSAVGIVYRSKVSKTAEGSDLSAIYAVLSSLDSLIPLISSPTVNLLYRSTLHYFPGSVFLLRASISLTLLLLLVILIFVERKNATLNQVQPYSTEKYSQENDTLPASGALGFQ